MVVDTSESRAVGRLSGHFRFKERSGDTPEGTAPGSLGSTATACQLNVLVVGSHMICAAAWYGEGALLSAVLWAVVRLCLMRECVSIAGPLLHLAGEEQCRQPSLSSLKRSMLTLLPTHENKRSTEAKANHLDAMLTWASTHPTDGFRGPSSGPLSDCRQR